MKPIDIPSATVEAHGASYVSVSAPLDFEFTDGTKPEAFEGMRIGDVVYTLIGIENEGELEALKRTKCFYLGFYSGNIPIFTIRVADVIFGEAPVEEELPAIVNNFDLFQMAKDSWPTLGNYEIAYMEIPRKSRFIQKVGTDERHQEVFMSETVEAGSFVLHSFVSGETIVVPREWLDFLNGSEKAEPEREDIHNSGEGEERIRKEGPSL